MKIITVSLDSTPPVDSTPPGNNCSLFSMVPYLEPVFLSPSAETYFLNFLAAGAALFSWSTPVLVQFSWSYTAGAGTFRLFLKLLQRVLCVRTDQQVILTCLREVN